MRRPINRTRTSFPTRLMNVGCRSVIHLVARCTERAVWKEPPCDLMCWQAVETLPNRFTSFCTVDADEFVGRSARTFYGQPACCLMVHGLPAKEANEKLPHCLMSVFEGQGVAAHQVELMVGGCSACTMSASPCACVRVVLGPGQSVQAAQAAIQTFGLQARAFSVLATREVRSTFQALPTPFVAAGDHSHADHMPPPAPQSAEQAQKTGRNLTKHCQSGWCCREDAANSCSSSSTCQHCGVQCQD